MHVPWWLGRLAAPLLLAVAGVATADEHVYVRPGDPVAWTVREAPLPEVASGGAAARLVARAAARQEADEKVLAFQAPAPLPLGLDTTRARVAVLQVRRTFTVGTEAPAVRVLTLRARYLDGLVATVNGAEIARRNVAADAPPETPAVRAHGPEWEAFYAAVAPGLLREGENELVVEVRPSAARLAPALELSLAGSDLGHVVRGPLVQGVGPGAATIVFETDLPMLGEVRWGTAASSYEHRIADRAPGTRHVLLLHGLPEGGAIHYQVVVAPAPGATQDGGPDYAFHTAPATGEVVRFVVYGDVRGGHEVHADLARAVVGEGVDFVVSTGDMVLRGVDEADWQRYFAVSGDLLARVPVYPVVGNHDTGGGEAGGRRLEDVFALPVRPEGCPPGAAWYSFDVGGVHVVTLDSNHYDDERQLAWLRADLAAARRQPGTRAIFAAAHKGPFSHGPHGGDATAAARYVPLLVAAGTSLFFSGHDHLYERGEAAGLGYVVSGGGGAPLYAPRCGTGGRPSCKSDGAQVVSAVHHYLVLEVYRDRFTMCTRRPDGSLVEACLQRELRQPPSSGPALSEGAAPARVRRARR